MHTATWAMATVPIPSSHWLPIVTRRPAASPIAAAFDAAQDPARLADVDRQRVGGAVAGHVVRLGPVAHRLVGEERGADVRRG